MPLPPQDETSPHQAGTSQPADQDTISSKHLGKIGPKAPALTAGQSATSQPKKSEFQQDQESRQQHRPGERMAPAVVAALYAEHGEQLRGFLQGVLRDGELAGEALQAAFVKAVELGHTARQETIKAWLFRVAFHEALAIRRRQLAGQKAWEQACQQSAPQPTTPLPDELLLRLEAVQAVRQALDRLPPEQRQVVKMRIYEEKTFAIIADELGQPLGTVLSRMQSALRKLRGYLDKSS